MDSNKPSSSSLPPPLGPPPGFEFHDRIINSPSFSPVPSHLFLYTGSEKKYIHDPMTFTKTYNSPSSSTTTPPRPPPPQLPAHFFPPPGYEHKFHHGSNIMPHTYSHPLINSNFSSSPAVNNFSNHSLAIKRVMHILKTEFGPQQVSLTSSSSSSININIGINNHINNMSMMLMNSYPHSDHHDLLASSSSSRPQGPPSQTVIINNNNRKATRRRNADEGRICSLTRVKYGPYTCPRCLEVSATSQKFASHVRNQHHNKLQKLNDGASTSARVDAASASALDASSADDHSHASAPAHDHKHDQITSALPLSGVKIKPEPTN